MKFFGGKLQFGLPRVEGLSQYIDELFCQSEKVASWGVAPKFMTGTNFPYILAEKAGEILLSEQFESLERALLVALSFGYPYIIILGDEEKLGGREACCRIIQNAWVNRKKCAVYNLFSSNEEFLSFCNDLTKQLDNTSNIPNLSAWTVVMKKKENSI